jgi:hypothetical protein
VQGVSDMTRDVSKDVAQTAAGGASANTQHILSISMSPAGSSAMTCHMTDMTCHLTALAAPAAAVVSART